ncbi:DUF2637 domain-containing protein [Brevibacterium sp. XM4083]|uniref:DUF2637 domain-containing protein n=1 Tax=Brevibacterium sp. XM4083 TaxID=2583238 RepID=UPI00112B730C|nr:DUF2637 domain-containing protein [Brevibacterium sp. XM4083]MCM1014399.1 DUF2637 domain-containing protein [Brevibacterium sp. XM4083]
MSRARGYGWAVVTAASGTVIIGAGAFWLSFVALADLAVRSGIAAGQSGIWPLLVDGLIVVATVAVVALDGRRTAWYPWTLLIGGAGVSVTANAAHAILTADLSIPAVLAAVVAAIPPVVLLAATHLTVVLTRPADHDDTMPSTPVETSALTGIENTEASEENASLEPVEDSPASALPALPAPDSAAASARETAPVASGDSGSDRRVRAMELRGLGWSNKQIAREVGVHPSTVGRWFTAPTGAIETPDAESIGTQEEHEIKERDHEPARE